MKPCFIHSSYVNALAFTPDGQFLAAGGRDGLIFIWDVLSGKEIKKLHGHTNRINSLAFHPQSGELISADQDGVVRMWRL
jgi:WD40 repeat protein